MTTPCLHDTAWLAKKLGLSVSTIERLRTRGQGDLPPYLQVGLRTIRYDESVVDEWLRTQRQDSPRVPPAVPPQRRLLLRATGA